MAVLQFDTIIRLCAWWLWIKGICMARTARSQACFTRTTSASNFIELAIESMHCLHLTRMQSEQLSILDVLELTLSADPEEGSHQKKKDNYYALKYTTRTRQLLVHTIMLVLLRKRAFNLTYRACSFLDYLQPFALTSAVMLEWFLREYIAKQNHRVEFAFTNQS